MNTPRAELRRSTILAILLAVAVAALMSLPLIYAATATDYEYRVPVVITNGATTTLDYPVCAFVNPPGLVTGGFLQSDALDAAAFDGAEAEIGLTRQDPTSTTDCWWIDPPQDLLAGQVAASYLHLGASQTGDHDVHGVLRVDADSIDVLSAADNASWENNNFSIFAGTFTLDALPITTGIIAKKAGAYIAGINSSGRPYLTVYCSAGPCKPTSPITITSSVVLVLGTSYNLSFSANVSGSSVNDGIWIDGALSAYWFGVGTATVNASALTFFSGMSAKVENFRFYDGVIYNHSAPAACTAAHACWEFAPDELLQTQEGNAGNSWVWLGSVDNTGSTGATQDSVYSFTRDMASITVDVQALQVKAALPTALTVPVLVDVIGTVPDLGSATLTADANAFTGLDTLKDAAFFAGGSNQGILLGVMVFLGSMLGGALILVTKQSFMGSVGLGSVLFVGGPIGFYGWAWVAVGLLMIVAMSGAMAFFGRR